MKLRAILLMVIIMFILCTSTQYAQDNVIAGTWQMQAIGNSTTDVNNVYEFLEATDNSLTGLNSKGKLVYKENGTGYIEDNGEEKLPFLWHIVDKNLPWEPVKVKTVHVDALGNHKEVIELWFTIEKNKMLVVSNYSYLSPRYGGEVVYFSYSIRIKL